MRTIVLTLMLAAVAFAGCAETTDDPAETEPVQEAASDLGNTVNATVQDGSFVSAEDADAFIMSGKTGPDTPLTSFHWRVPQGSMVPHEYFSDWSVLPLEFFPSTDATMSEWGLMVFQTDGNDAQMVGMYAAVTTHTVSKLAVLPTETTQTPVQSGFFLTLSDFEVAEGDRLTFVVFGTSDTEDSLDFSFRVMDADPDFDAEPPTKPSDVLQGEVVELLPYGSGSGVDLALYIDFNVLGIIGIEAWTDDVTVTDRLPADARPVANVRDVTISGAQDSDSGYTQSVGLFFAGDAVGLWSVDVDARGLQYGANSVIAESSAPYASLATFLVFGMPLFAAEADGNGGSQIDFNLQFARPPSSSLLGDVTLFQQIDLGASLEELTGVRGNTAAFGFTGLAGNVPPSQVDMRGDDLIIEGPVSYVFQDILAKR